MSNAIDLKFYWAVFKRRLPYFVVIAALISAIGIVVAYTLPPVYQSSARMLVEPQQIPGDLAQSTVPVNPFEQIQIIEQRIMTRANIYDLAERIGLYAGQPDLSVGDIVSDMRDRIQFIGFEPDPTVRPDTPGATIIGVAFDAPTPEFANKGANELVSLILDENVRMRTGRANETLEFFKAEVERLQREIEQQSEKISAFKTQNVDSLPDSLVARRAQQQREQERLLTLEREEADLRNQRSTVVWVYQRTGRASGAALSPEEEELQALKSELIQQKAVYASSSPRVRTLETRIKALENLVADQRAARSIPDAETGEAGKPMSELDQELAPIDARLKFIADEKATIQKTLDELDTSVQQTPSNEMVLAGMERELDNLQRQYQEAATSLGQAQVGERIEVLSKGQRFSLIEAPSRSSAPVRPKRMLISSAGVVVGLGVAAAVILIWEAFNRSIRRPLDLNGLGIQPIATIPYIRTQRELRWKRGIVFGALALIVVLIPLTLLAVRGFDQPLEELPSGTAPASTDS